MPARIAELGTFSSPVVLCLRSRKNRLNVRVLKHSIDSAVKRSKSYKKNFFIRCK
jgi:hypothetical protein